MNGLERAEEPSRGAEEEEALMERLCHFGLERAALIYGRAIHPRDPRRVLDHLWEKLWEETGGLDAEGLSVLSEAIGREERKERGE